ncbi:MAG: DnaJ domain-containing protein [Polyangiaceae bacterium]|nr:DnaJ domain-containing protein [Polyangiaceae bacterium]
MRYGGCGLLVGCGPEHSTAMRVPVEVSAAQFFDFIQGSERVVMFVSLDPAYTYNMALVRWLEQESDNGIWFGTAGFLDLLLGDTPALPFLHVGLYTCGVHSPIGALPGYYLFQNGRMVGWDAGLPGTEDASLIAKGSLLGFVAFAFTNDVGLILKGFRFAAEEATGARLAQRFKRIFEEVRQSRAPRPESEGGDLTDAYTTLGVDPSASDEEVERAWRDLRVKFHPDLVADDPVEFERRSRLASKMNRARDRIRAARSS